MNTIAGEVTKEDLQNVNYSSTTDCAICRSLRRMGFDPFFGFHPDNDSPNYSLLTLTPGIGDQTFFSSELWRLDSRSANLVRKRARRQNAGALSTNKPFNFTLTKVVPKS